jgi:hypothetical protein
LVSGTSIYEIGVTIRALPPKSWSQLAAECIGQIDSLVDLLRGRLPADVMQTVTRKERGLFPAPKDIAFECSCPDRAGMCKHVAATLYGVGVRLDDKPGLLFELRGVNHADLVGGAADAVPHLAKGAKDRKVIKGADLSALFGIELASPANAGSIGQRDDVGNRAPATADDAKAGRAKSARGGASANVSQKPDVRPRGTRRARGKIGNSKRRQSLRE